MPRAATARRRRALLGEARAYIRRSYTDPDLSLREVAEAVGSSPRQLQRVFREVAGEDFRDYLLRVRMRRGVQLLTRKRDPLPIYLVAGAVGYRQHSGFRQAFLRHFRYNPSEIQEPPDEMLYAEVDHPAESVRR